MHSTWSDGSQTLEDIVEAGIARGYSFCAVTDHSYGLPIAGGVSMADARASSIARSIALNKQYRRQVPADQRHRSQHPRRRHRRHGAATSCAQLELVVAAPHSVLRSAADQTARMVNAVQTPGVHILGHPRGRKYGSRPGVSADWDRVFEAAKRANVAIEIDGDPSRQDLDYDLARRAVAAGCLFALDSDAHSTAELAYAETAIAHARLAGVPTRSHRQLLAG